MHRKRRPTNNEPACAKATAGRQRTGTLYRASTLVTASLFAAVLVQANPYTSITDRNAFSLKPIVKPEETPAVQPTPPVKLTLTGITTILGNKRALLSAQVPAKPGEQAKTESYMLTEGQRADGIEVISIDEKAGKVAVLNNGISETLDFLNHGAKLMAAAPTGNPAGVIPASNAVGRNPDNSGPVNRQIPSRNVRSGVPADPSAQNETQGLAANLGNNALTRQAQNVTPEEQALMIEGQRIMLQDQGRHEEANMFPITEITPQDTPSTPSPY